MGDLYLSSLANLSDAAAKALAEAIAKSRRPLHLSGLDLSGLEGLPDKAPHALAKPNSKLFFDGLTSSLEAREQALAGKPIKFNGVVFEALHPRIESAVKIYLLLKICGFAV